jgi:CRISPR-associated protein Csb2
VSTTLAIRFPLGRYHANPWDRAVNEGTTEWPPSPWRVLRALVATWYTRWPDLPAPVLDGLLDALADPPSYRLPHTVAGHTRHYLPDLEHRKGEQGSTDLTLDPFLSVPPEGDLLIRWEADLDVEQRAVLAKLAELLPYLGRAESVCEAVLGDDDPVIDGTWWRPGADGTDQVRLLVPVQPISRPLLEATTADVRRSRRTVPPGTTWVTYARNQPPVVTERPDVCDREDVTAVQFALLGPVPMRATRAVLLADVLHREAGHALKEAGISEERCRLIMGTNGAKSGHEHAHWIPVPDNENRGSFCRSVLIWVPQGLRTKEVRALLSVDWLSGKLGGADGYELRGFPKDLEVRLQAVGPVQQIAPKLSHKAKHWRSLTPYLPVRHRKGETLDEYVAGDVAAELRYRDVHTQIKVTRLSPGSSLMDHWASEFRRHRVTERLGGSQHSGKRSWASRPGLGLRLEFTEEVPGPLVLGQLSHFGFGLFIPE